jgi:hypothetical protein
MRIRQYVYFSLDSGRTPAAELTERLGLAPDRTRVRGSRSAGPPRPMCHSWQIVCDEAGLRVDEQVARVLARLQPLMPGLAALSRQLAVDDPHGGARLEIVRYLDVAPEEDGDDEEDRENAGGDPQLRRLPGQHQLLGWHLDRAVLEFLVATGAEVDVDEYG